MTASPEHCAERPPTPAEARRSPQAPAGPPAPGPDGGHDLLSELLRSVRLSGERIVAYAPPPTFSVGIADLGSLHMIEEGELVLRIDGDPRVEYLRRGDVVLLPRGDAHRLTDAPERDVPGRDAAGHDVPGRDVPGRDAAGRDVPGHDVAERDAAGPARWLCGTFTIGDPQASHLLGSLPSVIILRGTGGPALEGLDVARRMLVLEMRSPSQGSAVMIARILDLVFIQILRAWAAGPDAEPNWLAGALDPQTGPALSAIHQDPGRDWTVEELARACTLSRSAFAARFVAHVGTPPATYLAQVRLDTATSLLRDTALPVSVIAKNVGYTSEAAFSRAFKSRYGMPPVRWRHDHRGSAPIFP